MGAGARPAGPALGAALLSALLLGATAAVGVEAPPDPAADSGWSYALAVQLMSPFCPGRSLADCPSPDAETLRMWIRVQEAAGRRRDDVEAELLERYGDAILAAPRAEGFGLTAYAVPVLAFLGGGALVGAFLWRQTRTPSAPGAEPGAPPAPLDPELERAIDDEMSR